MKEIVIVKPLELANNYDDKVLTTIRVGKLELDLTLTKNGEETVLEKPENLKILEELGVELNYQPILQQYEAIVSDLENFRANAKERKLRRLYKESEVVKMMIPTIDGAEITIETEDDFATKERGWSSVSEPDIYVTISGFKSVVRYRYTGRSSWSRTNERMRFVVSNKVTDDKPRQYSTLKAVV